jgi:alkanesulfonate monooxygenase SsuD/methylene tetrahydromethanopterin reductase-like flavin-dependent oxidoreductase (luciferase family)
MTDYGHDLLFGTFVTPSAQSPQKVVDLAVTADRAGLDLVTFQDHPYQPAFLDTWTLISYAAARTSRVHLAGNVHSLPLRPPATLARSVASLDRLSDGRIELGIGAGAFWDGIEAMGGRRLTAAQGVTALREAISIIREVWDVSTRGGIHLDGEFYQVDGAKRGPEPAHDIPIWVGSYKPKMLELTGAYADGWLPTLEYIEGGLDSVPGVNRRIDEAAAAAGRSPGDVRRLLNLMNVSFQPTSRALLNGPVDQWVEDLAGLVLEYGFSTSLIGGDDPAVAERFAAEVAPQVRDLVTRERS